jgi:transcriptional regulator with XRE-family HTH domain
MEARRLIRTARQRSGLTLRQLAARAGTSHSTLAAYESGRTTPNADTLERVLRAAGFAVDVVLCPRVDGPDGDRSAKGDELIEALELAEMFPARHEPTLSFPRFGVDVAEKLSA